MSRWTRHLARSLFWFAGKPAPAEDDEEAFADPPPQRAAPLLPTDDADQALLRACADLRARHARGDQTLAAVPEGAWREFADAVTQSDGALQQAVRNITEMRAHGAAGLRAKAEAMQIVLDGAAEDADLAASIACSLIADILAVTPATTTSASAQTD
jgi:hypothetical protein